jgi:catechol 2,3-dioxygenase-like lactoylglutathione lyase family enzyme
MIDHLSLAVADVVRSRAFYDALLAPLGYGRVMDVDEASVVASGYGADGKPSFWIGPGAAAGPAAGQHVAFAATSRAAVDAFHRAGLAAGGRDNGAPGLRPHYHPSYYAAFVIDPDGHHLEAVCHRADG